MASKKSLALVLSLLLTATFCCPAAAGTINLKVTSQADGVNVPVHTPVKLAGDLAKANPRAITVTLQQDGGGKSIPGQIVDGESGRELWWIIPATKANKANLWTATLADGKTKLKETFSFRDTAGKHLDVALNSKPVTRYMYERDTTDDKTKHITYKVYNHVFDEKGEKFLTKGAGGRFTHHRGIFIGFSRTKANGKSYDTWHMKGVTQRHQKFAKQAAGPVLARYTTLINWNEGEDKPIISEQRTITVYNQGNSAILLLDFHTKLTAVSSDIVLDGDPEHAGCQYRPHNDVAKNKSAKYLFHAEGVKPQKVLDLPWVALTYKLNDKQYHVQHLSHPSIPKGNKYSAYRDYGRFGAYFKKPVAKGETLELRYRFYVAKGDMPDRKEMSQRYTAFVTPPKAVVFEK
ncbi:MAG: PmoA family protein [Phycisphaerae bacterium]|jgi:hypothetical protein|nr:PmoA family protein [Phycisphaerae bacterium]